MARWRKNSAADCAFPTFFRPSAVLSLPAVLFRKVSNIVARVDPVPFQTQPAIRELSRRWNSWNKREFKNWRRQWQCHKSMIWLVESGKIIVLHVRHARDLPNYDAKFSYLRFWRQRYSAALYLSFFAFGHENYSCKASESALSLFCSTWATRSNRKTLNLARSSVLMWRFRCSSHRSLLSSLLPGSLTIRPVARKGYGAIAHEAKPNGLLIRGPRERWV